MKVSNHAVRRYRERLQKDHMTDDQIRYEIYQLLKVGRRVACPAWVNPALYSYPAPDYYVELSDGIACPVARETALTVLVRGGMGPDARAYRNRKRAARRRARVLRARSESREQRPETAA